MSFDIRILGANSAVPNKDRFPTCQCVSIHNESILIDCGEGAQINFTRYKIKPSRLKTILISHLHGDHVYGLPGLLNSFNLNGRTDSIQIFGPVGIVDFLKSVFRHTYVNLQYELDIIELDNHQKHLIKETSVYTISAFPMIHRVPTYGYLIREKDPAQNVNPEAIDTFGLNIQQIKDAKSGLDVMLEDGRLIENQKLTLPPKQGRSYAYCSDTVYDKNLVPHIKSVDVLYHEATYLHNLKDKAFDRKHATSLEAGMIAKAASVNRLLIGHYSSRYDDLKPLENEAKSIFSNTQIVMQGDLFSIDFR